MAEVILQPTDDTLLGYGMHTHMHRVVAVSQNAPDQAFIVHDDGSISVNQLANTDPNKFLTTDSTGKLVLATPSVVAVAAWGSITGTLSAQTDLQNALNAKQGTITAGTTAQYYRGDKTFQTLDTSVVPENGNLYHTNARTIASVLTGYASGAGTVSATDSILSAIQKLNGNIAGLTTGVSSVFGRVGAVTATSGDYNTSQVTENASFLYFTNARAIGATLTGYTSGAGSITSSDSILTAIQKLNGNVSLLTGAIIYQGIWDASTNTPTLTSGSGTKGFLYKVSVAGSTNLDGITQWNIGDAAVFNGATWDKLDGTATEVLSVFGRVGAVVATAGDYSSLTETLSNKTITAASNTITLANLSATNGTLTFSGTYTGGTARTIGLNLGSANTWTANQQFPLIGINQSPTSNIGVDIFADGTTLTQGMRVQGGLATTQAVGAYVTGDANLRFTFRADGRIVWGNGTAGADTNLYRTGIGILNTDGTFTVGTSIGIITSAPTHSLTLGSTSTGIAYYNTTDQTTNYERMFFGWSTNIFQMFTQSGGTGTIRNININANGTSLVMGTGNGTGTNFATSLIRNSTTQSLFNLSSSAMQASTSVVQIGMLIDPTINMSNGAGYTMLKINPTENAVGSGLKLLADFQVGGVSRVSIDNTGLITSTKNGLGTSPTDSVLINNTTLAANNVQQISPALHFSSQGWGTTAGTSQDVSFQVISLPVQGTVPSGILQFQTSIAGGAFTNAAQLTSAGGLSAGLLYSTAGATSVAFQSNATIANANFVSITTGIASASTSTLLFAGASTINFRNYLGNGVTSSVLGINNSYAGTVIGSGPVNTAASGTHSLIANMVINPVGTVTSGGATVTTTASLYINGAGSGGSANYSLLVNSGFSAFNGGMGTSISGNSVSNFASPGSTGVLLNNANTAVQFASSSAIDYRSIFSGNTNTTLTANANYASVVFGRAVVSTPATGTNAWLANAVFTSLGTVTAGGATVTNTATVFIDGASVAGSTNYALYVASGISYLGGALTLGAVVNTAGAAVSVDGTQTLTNKRITKRVLSLSANSATPTINTDTYDYVHITAQTAAITSMTSGLSGTPVDGDTLRFSITGTGAVAITWGSSFETGASVPPTTTVGTTRLDVAFYWNTETSKWRCMSSG